MKLTAAQNETMKRTDVTIKSISNLDGVIYIIGVDKSNDFFIHTNENVEPIFLSDTSMRTLISLLGHALMDHD